MKYFSILGVLFLSIISSHAQKYDNIWVLGYHGQNQHPLQNTMLINFLTSPSEVIGLNLPSGMSFDNTCASISDTFGNLLFYTNGIYIANSTHDIMESGDSINNTGITYLYDETGLPLPQGAIVLPIPNSDSLYILFHEPLDYEPNGLGYYNPILFYSIINMNLNNGLGKVLEKDVEVISDTLASGKIAACKHANGRDWWILVPEDDNNNNGIYKILLTPEGVIIEDKAEPPVQLYNLGSVGNAIFTPDGTKYIRQDIRFNPWNVVTIYDFDRCTGTLSFLEQFEIPDTSFIYGGAVVSSDSRFLYSVTNQVIYQYDLTAINIESTKTIVAQFDGYYGLVFKSVFGTPQLAPNGQIYIAAAVTDTVMHVIRTPNQPGILSHVDQHAIHLPKINQKSIPNFPYFRLGPLDGSPCDTLGLDNHPKAAFTWWPNELLVAFSDNSYYRPESWAWDFGEPSSSSGNTSAERNPVHDYDAPGEYQVCLIVSNEYDSDTICHWVLVDTLTTMVDVTAPPGSPANGVAVHPNPANESVSITLRYPLAKPGEWVLYSAIGERLLSRAIPVGTAVIREVSLSGLPPGLYFWSMATGGASAAVGKLVISR